jgi:hypothetical protein
LEIVDVVVRVLSCGHVRRRWIREDGAERGVLRQGSQTTMGSLLRLRESGVEREPLLRCVMRAGQRPCFLDSLFLAICFLHSVFINSLIDVR